MIRCDHLTKYYGKKRVLQDINFDAGNARVLALLGPNGAGKTTLADILIGLKRPSSGEYVFNREFDRRAVQFQNIPLLEYLSVRDNVKFFSRVFDLTVSNSEIDKYLEEWNLIESRDTRVKKISGGQKQALSILIALLNQPEFLILDEPMNNLDPQMRVKVRNKIIKMKENGTFILYISHDLAEIGNFADRFVFVENGMSVCEGTENEIISQQKTSSLEEAYLKIFE